MKYSRRLQQTDYVSNKQNIRLMRFVLLAIRLILYLLFLLYLWILGKVQ